MNTANNRYSLEDIEQLNRQVYEKDLFEAKTILAEMKKTEEQPTRSKEAATAHGEGSPETSFKSQKKGGVSPPPTPGRNRFITFVLMASAASIILVLVLLQHLIPNATAVAMSRDGVDPSPDSVLLNAPKRITHSGDSFILRNGDKVQFEGTHPEPLNYQWMLHVAKSARVVASASKTEKISYTLQQLDSNWEDGPSRYEFLIIVTANKLLPGWPEKVISPFELEGMFTREELSDLQDTVRKETVEERNDSLKQVLRAAFDRCFGINQCWFQVYVYRSENRS